MDLIFIKEFMNIIRSFDMLPEEFQNEINKIEVSDKNNSLIEKRVKSISIGEVKDNKKKVEKELEIRDLKTINKIEIK